MSIDDIEHLIDTGTAEGIVEPLEQKLALEALRLGERTVRDIMRPRIDLDAMDVDTPPEEILGTVAMAGFSRLPVYEGDLDHVIGFVHIKDLFRQQYLGWPIELRKLLHPALFVPENDDARSAAGAVSGKAQPVGDRAQRIRRHRGHGHARRRVEEIVGEMRDEHRRHEEQKFVQRDDGSWLIDGSVSDCRPGRSAGTRRRRGPGKAADFSTLGGLILDRLGQIPVDRRRGRVGRPASWRSSTWTASGSTACWCKPQAQILEPRSAAGCCVRDFNEYADWFA